MSDLQLTDKERKELSTKNKVLGASDRQKAERRAMEIIDKQNENIQKLEKEAEEQKKKADEAIGEQKQKYEEAWKKKKDEIKQMIAEKDKNMEDLKSSRGQANLKFATAAVGKSVVEKKCADQIADLEYRLQECERNKTQITTEMKSEFENKILELTQQVGQNKSCTECTIESF